MRWNKLFSLGLAFLTPALAQVASFSPQNGISFSIAIPDTTATSGSGPIFFQIKGPDSIQWLALGQGNHMGGANIFVVYSSSSSNVTVSPRLGKGHVQPLHNADARVSLLEGSGISNGVMTANVRCDTCIEWNGGSLDPSSSSSDWIWANKEGAPLDSTNVSASISMHDNNGGVTVDLTKAIWPNTSNPFLGFFSNGNSAVSSSSSPIEERSSAILKAHGVIMSFVFVLFFPIFAILVPLPWAISITKVHVPLQTFALSLAIAGMGLGIWLGVQSDKMDNAHPIIGLIVMGSLILFQPVLGFLQHSHFRQTGGKSVFAYGHRWLGRIMLILGITNGGLGFALAGIGRPGTPRSAMIVYSVIAGIVGVLYLTVHIVLAFTSRKRVENTEARNDGSN